jgi:hypothetical protein
VPWRYAVLSNMLLALSSPPASAATAQPIVAHYLSLLHSDMLLLRQLGGAGLWLTLAHTSRQRRKALIGGSSSGRSEGGEKEVASGAVLEELRQVRAG